MINLLKKIDSWLLPKNLNEQFSPYVWLIYLPLFFVPEAVYFENVMDLIWVSLATIVFLGLYFHAHWVTGQQVIYHIIGILILSTLAALITPTASTLFIYASAFCSRLRPLKYAFTVLISILVLVAMISWIFNLTLYFYLPTMVFSLIVGLLNIYQYALHESKQALILSRQETKRLAQVAERERIARDLHDLIGHTFSVITLKADLAGKLLHKGQPKDVEKAKAEIKQLEDISRDALSQVREVVSGYRTSDVLSELANARSVLSSMEISFTYQIDNIDEQTLELDAKSNKEMAIVLRELLTNIIKHANATQVTVCIYRQNDNIVLSMQDNGQGFDQTAEGGFGIQGIKERVQSLNGFVNIQSGGSHSGTLSKIGLPITAKE